MSRHRVVIVGGGFGGLYAAMHLRKADVDVTLVDRRNFHLFQPLLYQVATGGLSPGDISAPLRAVLKRQRNTRVLLAEVTGFAPRRRIVHLQDTDLTYDTLIVGAGATHHYYGNDGWAEHAWGLKSVEDATRIRARILRAFERAERAEDPSERRALLTFVIVGAGPTGVELAGAIGELALHTLREDFRNFDPGDARIVLVEGSDRVLPGYPERLSRSAAVSLAKLGVRIRTETKVLDIGPRHVRFEGAEDLRAETVLWAAGVTASPLAGPLAAETGAEIDRGGRIRVAPDCTLPGHPEIFVIGDMARIDDEHGRPLPGVAPVAMQQGSYAARALRARLRGRRLEPFHYRNRGNLSVIGRAAAVADLGRFRFSGYPAWLLWLFVHILYLVGFENRLLVFFQWAYSYFTRKRGARLITGS